MVRNVLRLVLAVNSVSKGLNRVEKIPIFCDLEQCQPEGFTVHVNIDVIFGVIFMMLSDSKWIACVC